ncbi:MAG: DUF4388 domain-containing protein [Acidithiobacillales bacterium]
MSFQGSLSDLPLSDIVQLVAVSGKTGMFSLTRASEQGAVYLQNGQITHARAGDVEGEDAIYALALWTTGTFQFSPGVEIGKQTITRSNTNLLMEAARRSDEWKILSKKIPSTDATPRLVASDRLAGPITLTPQEWIVITRCDGRTTIDEIARGLKKSSFDVAKTLFGLVTAALVEVGRPAAPPPPNRPSPAPLPQPSSPPPGVPSVTTHTGVFQAISKGDERRSLQILCTKVKQEAETFGMPPGETEIERLYRAALADIDRGRSLDAVRELVRSLEAFLARRRGPDTARTFHDRMAPLV